MANLIRILAVDPAIQCGLAALVFDPETGEKWAWAEEGDLVSSTPAPATLRAWARQCLLSDEELWLFSEEPWCYVAEAMYFGVNAQSAIHDTRIEGMMLQALSEEFNITSQARYQAVVWRRLFGPDGHRLPTAQAKEKAVEYVQREFGLTLPHNAAEALCIAAHHLQRMQHALKDERISALAGQAVSGLMPRGRKVRALPDKIAAQIEAHGDLARFRVPQTKRTGLGEIIGQWPGDETDEEIAADLEDVS